MLVLEDDHRLAAELNDLERQRPRFSQAVHPHGGDVRLTHRWRDKVFGNGGQNGAQPTQYADTKESFE